MTGERPNRFFANGRVFRQARNERVPQIVPTNLDAGDLQGASPGAFPFTDRSAEIYIAHAGFITAWTKANAMARKQKCVRSSLTDKFQPFGDRFPRAICERHDAPRSGLGFGFWNDDLGFLDLIVFPPRIHVTAS